MSREFVALAVVVISMFFAGSFMFLSLFDKVQQQQADLELSMAVMNKNTVHMHLFMKSKKAAAKIKKESVEDL
jgi:integral membrane sensor domain MASE1